MGLCGLEMSGLMIAKSLSDNEVIMFTFLHSESPGSLLVICVVFLPLIIDARFY
jgi:hypothetical protein